MKKIFFLILIQLVFINAVYGSYVDTTTAKTVATNFFVSRISQSKQARVKSLSAQKIEIELVHQEFDDSVALNNQYNKEPYYYVYNVKDDNGFIIVSADDAVTPILGYAFEGKYDSINQPPAFIEWMSNLKKQLKSIKIANSNGLIHVKSEWAKIKTANTITNETTSSEVAPLLSTTWNQGCYYNSYCPQDLKGACGHVPVGCVAVAMGQIINYLKYPNACNDIPGYKSNYGQQPTINSTTYNWDNMANILTDSTSATKVNAVAELLFHCGVAVQMNYGVDISGTWSSNAASAFCKYFNYSSSVKYISKSDYSAEEWKSLLNNELNHSRPLYYDGQGSGGHAFVCDGYQNSDYYHFNWGWGGNSNGYFYIDNLNPAGRFYNISQGAIIGISPVSLPVIDYSISEIKDGGLGSDAGIGNGNGIAEPGETIELPITLMAIGLGASNNVIATLSCDDADITIINSTQGWDSIAPDSIKITNYAFNISLICPAKDVTFTLRITSDEDSWTRVFKIHVFKINRIKIDVAGTLNTLLTPAEKTSTVLILIGTIDARDFKTIRDSLPLLSTLDIYSATIVAYTGTEGTATSTSTTYPANTVPQNAFYNKSISYGKVTLISVTMPSTITSIGSYAFENCSSLTGPLTIPSSVTSIGDSSFYRCNKLTSLSFPSSVTTIGNSAFAYCSGLTGPLTIPASVTSIEDSSFYSCNKLTSLSFPSSVTTIGSSAFENCSGLTGSLTIPSSVTSIGSSAFAYCSGLTESLSIPSSVTIIGNSAFAYCRSLNGSLTIPLSVTSLGDHAFSGCSGIKYISLSANITAIKDYTFENCRSLTGSLTIPSTVTSIGNYSFSGCNKLTSLYIPSTVTTIGNYAFAYCSSLNGSLTIPLSVTSLGYHAFSGCSGIKSISLSAKITAIKEYTFENCSGLTESLTIPSTVTSIGNSSFSGCNKLTSLYIPSTVTTIGNSAFAYCSSLTGSLTIPSSVTSIGSSAFASCSGLTGSLTIPLSVTIIGNYSFLACYGLTGSLTIPSSVTSLGYGAFYNCSGIESISLSANITAIKDYTFAYCSGLTGSLTIPSTVTSIGNYSFSGCNKLTSLYIPSSVTTIGNSAFASCNGLTSILAYKTTPVNLSSSSLVFGGVNKTTCRLSVPSGTKSTYEAALQWKDFTKILEFVKAVPTLNDDSISIYPNPVTDGFQIKGIEGIVDFKLTDLYGKLLLHKQVSANESVSVNTFPLGMYMINISNNGVSYQRKVIKK